LKLTIVGTGLIGGSVARAARAGRSRTELVIVGVDPDEVVLARALELGIVDRAAALVPEDADLVCLACPGAAVAPHVVALAGHAGVIFDTGSVKAPILAAVVARIGRLPERFVPCHPVAGSELSGPDAATGDLFAGARVVLTPTADTDPGAVERVAGFWRTLGATTRTMDAAAHDATLALTSHLPHLIAFACAGLVPDGVDDLVGGGFRDFSRIAASDPELWQGIFELNRGPLLAALGRFRAALDELEASLINGDRARGLAHHEAAARRRRAFDGR
jgi:prephenate dehydrogenase